MREIMILNDGTELIGRAEESYPKLFVYVYGKTFQQMYQLMSNENNTVKMTFIENGITSVYENYTHLTQIIEISPDLIGITMTKE